ncbi:hypothetical protein H2201_001441 [Coniosporium apollinis]|uniref:Putative phospholipase n=1 Tax=Coniosporium apollinis TaxID=61459 RepID=A0ABQ9P690_9PEZI|nr:hypothetical protein H2201_001441 [Coniosporium apollinis]
MSFLSHLNPTPGFPSYTGPYQVGSVDVEIPVTDLEAPSPAPDSTIATTAFRVFYPCEPGAHERPVRWIPNPQRGYVSAYARFLGAGSAFSELFSFFPQLLYYISIPVHRNARLLPAPTKSARWPVLVFSHGLGGTRNTYSHLAGSLSSHGIVVIAPDHRDGSAPIAYVRATSTSEAREVPYRNVPHKPSPDTWAQRDEQLKIRLWELGLVHDALLKIDQGAPLKNLDPNTPSNGHFHKGGPFDALSLFRNALDIHRPGAITWAGHSFGAATTVQFVKSVCYRPSAHDAKKHNYTPLFKPSGDSPLAQQITPQSPVMLLDLWCLPLHSPATAWLWAKPLPAYAPSGPGGTAILAVLSEAFFKWSSHLRETKRVLSESPTSDHPRRTKPPPRFFYAATSAHLSQSDFGVLFPWVTKRVFKAEEPVRTLTLNTRAMLQVMREAGIEVAETSKADREAAEEGRDDAAIVDPRAGIRGWIPLTTDLDEREEKRLGERERREDVNRGPGEAVMEGEVLGQVRSGA